MVLVGVVDAGDILNLDKFGWALVVTLVVYSELGWKVVALPAFALH